MPPKPKYTREQITDAAFELVKESGIDALAARTLGKKLGTSSSPIFTFFSGMDELKDAVREMARTCFREYMEGVFDYKMAFKEFGMRHIRFAKDEPNLYRFIFLDSEESLYDVFDREFSDVLLGLIKDIQSTFGISEDDAKVLFNHMLIYANGIAGFCINNVGIFTEEFVSESISTVCISLVHTIKLRDGSFNINQAKAMSISPPVKPEKK